MRKSSLWHIIWIVGIYAILVSVLYLVVLYKVQWEDKDLRPYLYFYNCQGELCTSQLKPEKYYSSLVCSNDSCPYITGINKNVLALTNGKKSLLFDYISGKTVSEDYKTYRISSDGNYIVSNKNGLYGVINGNNEVLVDFNYAYIKDYNNGFISYSENNKYGIDNKEKEVYIKPEYEDIVLINDKIFAYLEDNIYYIASYTTGLPTTQNNYDFIYCAMDYLVVARNRQIDILDLNLESKLIMKISTNNNYTTEKERASLNFHTRDNYIYFSVYDNGKYINHMYDTKTNKLFVS